MDGFFVHSDGCTDHLKPGPQKRPIMTPSRRSSWRRVILFSWLIVVVLASLAGRSSMERMWVCPGRWIARIRSRTFLAVRYLPDTIFLEKRRRKTERGIQRRPDPVILPMAPSGDERNPYFFNLTTSKSHPRRRIKVHLANRSLTSIQSPFTDSFSHHHRGFYLVTTNFPWSVVLPTKSNHNERNDANSDENNERIASTREGRYTSTNFLETTSRQATTHECDIVATNGGPFDKGGRWNSGPVVRNGELVQTKANASNSSLIGFGVARNDTRGTSWILGTYGQLESMLLSSSSGYHIWEFASGFDWLVYHGASVANRSHTNNPTGVDRAPRTAIGLDRHKNLLLLVVDGCEHCTNRKGLNLEELAELLVELGALYAVNMDGGGSTTMVMPSMDDNRRYYVPINRPTCLDLPIPLCERKVATVLCVSSRQK